VIGRLNDRASAPSAPFPFGFLRPSRMARRRFLAGYEVDLRAALESAGVQGKAISRGRLYSDRDSEARLRGDGSGCNAFNLSNSRANLGVGRHRKNRISRRGDCIVCFGIYTRIYRANESLISSHEPSLYCQPTIRGLPRLPSRRRGLPVSPPRIKPIPIDTDRGSDFATRFERRRTPSAQISAPPCCLVNRPGAQTPQRS
jgi:hypothetical protein